MTVPTGLHRATVSQVGPSEPPWPRSPRKYETDVEQARRGVDRLGGLDESDQCLPMHRNMAPPRMEIRRTSPYWPTESER